jgi:hypothetical protein
VGAGVATGVGVATGARLDVVVAELTPFELVDVGRGVLVLVTGVAGAPEPTP